jgi:hypothetical protein
MVLKANIKKKGVTSQNISWIENHLPLVELIFGKITIRETTIMRVTKKIASIAPIIIFHFLDDDGFEFCWAIDVSSGLSEKSVISCSSVFLIKKKTKHFKSNVL